MSIPHGNSTSRPDVKTVNGLLQCPILSNDKIHFAKVLYYSGFWQNYVCKDCMIDKRNICLSNAVYAEKQVQKILAIKLQDEIEASD